MTFIYATHDDEGAECWPYEVTTDAPVHVGDKIEFREDCSTFGAGEATMTVTNVTHKITHDKTGAPQIYAALSVTHEWITDPRSNT